MASIDDQIEALVKEAGELSEKESEIARRQSQIAMELEELEKDRMAQSKTLSQEEEQDLRKQLTVLGNFLTQSRVLFASLSLKDEEPDDQEEQESGYLRKEIKGKYTIAITVNLIEEYGGPGLYIKACIKTKLPHVECVVRSMFDEEGCQHPTNPLTSYWSTNWDYGNRIVLKNPVSLD